MEKRHKAAIRHKKTAVHHASHHGHNKLVFKMADKTVLEIAMLAGSLLFLLISALIIINVKPMQTITACYNKNDCSAKACYNGYDCKSQVCVIGAKAQPDKFGLYRGYCLASAPQARPGCGEASIEGGRIVEDLRRCSVTSATR